MKSAREIRILLKCRVIDDPTARQSVRQSAGKEELLAAAVKYVRKRNGVFLYERRVPERVKREPAHYAVHFGSKPLFRVSLRTKDQTAMHAACIAVHREFERKLVTITNVTSPDDEIISRLVTGPRKAVTQADLDALAERYRRLIIEPFERAHVMADSNKGHALEYDRIVYEMELNAEDSAKALATRGGTHPNFDSPTEIAAWVAEKDGFEAPPGSPEFGAMVGAIRSGIQRGRNEMQALIEGRAIPRLNTPGSDDAEAAPTLSQAVDEYLSHKKLPVRTETEVRSSLRLFVGLIGNKRIDALTRRDFQTFAEHLAKQVIGGRTQGSITRPASSATVKKRIGLLRSVINHAIHRDKFVGPNPASGIKVDAYVARPNRAVMPEKRRLTVDEMNLIFQHPWFTGCASPTQTHAPGEHRLTGSEYWVPVVAAFTGCRASELGGLMLSEVILEGAFPHIVIRDNKYRRTKGGRSRKVPLLDELVSLGFTRYVEGIRKSGAERLFPDWQAPKGANSGRNDDKAWSNGKIIRAFNRTVIPNMLRDKLLPDARQEVTFHSLRGAFKGMLGGAEYKLHPNIINEVVGHAKSELDARYIGEISIEDTYAAIKGCRYKGLVVPRLNAHPA